MRDVLKTSSYDFELPSSQIATFPITPADSAKMLVFCREKNEIFHSTFRDILEFLPEELSIFLNDTKVVKARVFGKKSTGANIELLLNKPLFMDRYLVLIKGKVKVGTKIFFDEGLIAEVLELNEDGTRVVEFFQDENSKKRLNFLSLVDILNKIGHIPLPPYMNRDDEKDDETNYQTLFAKNYGAVAAPTASLHFTPLLLKKLEERYGLNYLTLHVGAGTFKPVDVEDILSHPMHSEYFEIGIEAKKNLDNAKKVLAVGTTVTRTIEYYERTNKIQGECDLFLNPMNKPIKVDYLLTNFHLPKSTLIMLVASFIGLEKTLELYDIAIKENYRFYSYGDGMLII
ncbi:tRNA preQ1(34) S-adenosylmethionine ribosyltransferase-isomerase QueA [Aliarcobacter trophiarum LMG 25534]|uniref:S-adenosylmethionine:tRNA ribosyltransferase-isomerase n=1 Tax=Aliarcobacter trophiarum LMG 25534 TaxID=1032241 RepID=A0AAD0QLF0_9BACT|nr:tRNA preQ1(34) S-adenosylmethionine ribosyltransferase-isomerase QueA [Aliarcobacter trophiarum]AXK48920.1 S-adenosylmethionine:tRNA ribosyltransferase-isomerase [Aliarcobacter trophiarum LMG 25534]RXJ92651.1 tRNA preQ1(34) S-adenosylmethionine ribosyltransferase-isomerase QueA [Aliarcobacter trophiarum LMG 25534]